MASADDRLRQTHLRTPNFPRDDFILRSVIRSLELGRPRQNVEPRCYFRLSARNSSAALITRPGRRIVLLRVLQSSLA